MSIQTQPAIQLPRILVVDLRSELDDVTFTLSSRETIILIKKICLCVINAPYEEFFKTLPLFLKFTNVDLHMEGFRDG